MTYTTQVNPDDHSPEELIFICPSYLDCVLAAGDADDLAALREWCAELPSRSYGRVFIETDSVDGVEEIVAPPGVGVTWILRRGEGESDESALVTAVDAWLDEWLRGDPLSGRHVRLWAGSRSDARMREHWIRIENELAEIRDAAADYRARSI